MYRNTRRFAQLASLALALLTLPALAAQTVLDQPAPPRTIQQFTTNWRFIQADPANAQSPDFDDSAWTTVTLPHDWSIAGPVHQDAPSKAAGGFFPTGIAWYRNTFDSRATAGQRSYIAFDGVMANSDVYINGQHLGHRPYGYVSFNYDLTPYLHPGKNSIAVRVDTSQQPASRWYTGSGINRQVRLVTTSNIHIAPWGTFVTTPKVSAASATVHVRVTVTNESAAPANISLAAELVSPHRTITRIAPSRPTTIAPNATQDLDIETILPNPNLWDLTIPALYNLHATILRDGQPIDDEEVPFGIREFRFDPDKGFFLNGVHYKILGVALHTDAGALGTAVPLAVWERRLTALRALGVNAIRTAHNPPAPEFLDLCDRMGFLVMNELFDAWTVAKNPYDYHLYFKEWSLRDVADTVKRDRNHPSIILWSAGNEIHDTPHPEIAIPILKSLVDTFHQYDPTRPVTQALFRPNVSHDYEDGLADLLDVVGQNYREQEILKAHADKPTRAIIGTENTHDRNQWVAMRDHPEYSGQFLWTGIDYLGEAGVWPAIGSGSGLLLTTALPRARAFERQSWWSTTPMVRIARRVEIAQKSPTDPGYEAPNAPAPTRFTQPLLTDWSPTNQSPHTENVEIYTNAEEVELFLNDKSLGTQKLHPDASPITYQVPFTPGTLLAVARTAGQAVAEETLRTAGKPAKLILSTTLSPLAESPTPPPPPANRPSVHRPVQRPRSRSAPRARSGPNAPLPTLSPDWNDVVYVTATLVDANGTVIPDSTTVIHFSSTGPGNIIAVDNGNLLDHDPFQATQRKLYDGHTAAILRATADIGNITVTATAPGIPSATITIRATPAKPATFERSF